MSPEKQGDRHPQVHVAVWPCTKPSWSVCHIWIMTRYCLSQVCSRSTNLKPDGSIAVFMPGLHSQIYTCSLAAGRLNSCACCLLWHVMRQDPVRQLGSAVLPSRVHAHGAELTAVVLCCCCRGERRPEGRHRKDIWVGRRLHEGVFNSWRYTVRFWCPPSPSLLATPASCLLHRSLGNLSYLFLALQYARC